MKRAARGIPPIRDNAVLLPCFPWFDTEMDPPLAKPHAAAELLPPVAAASTRGRCSRTSASSCYAGERVGLVGPNGAGKTTLHAHPRRPGRARRRRGAPATPARASPCCGSSRSSPPGRTLFAEAKTALDELLAAHDDMIHTAEALAKATDEAERKSSGRPLRPAQRAAAPPRRLQRRSPGRAGARRPRLPPRGLRPRRSTPSAAASRAG